ncbi:MAG: prepilin-type N-terminal cleavage/methylation domain-containing protein [Chitinispirillaceae bacterium]|nr:prepilin-type N-terminal cleavage/methylation domain-containing protein [Chitinispirillaceae bacterium]
MEPTTNRNSGFTLVEAVVTGVIIAIVTTTALLMYGGFIKEARRQTVENLAETAAASANAYVRRMGSDNDLDSAKLKLYFSNPRDYTVDIDTDNNSITITDITHDISVTKHY